MTQQALLGEARVLIVDDVQANVQLLERILRQSGYTNVRALTDSREVLGTYVAWEPDLPEHEMPPVDSGVF